MTRLGRLAHLHGNYIASLHCLTQPFFSSSSTASTFCHSRLIITFIRGHILQHFSLPLHALRSAGAPPSIHPSFLWHASSPRSSSLHAAPPPFPRNGLSCLFLSEPIPRTHVSVMRHSLDAIRLAAAAGPTSVRLKISAGFVQFKGVSPYPPPSPLFFPLSPAKKYKFIALPSPSPLYGTLSFCTTGLVNALIRSGLSFFPSMYTLGNEAYCILSIKKKNLVCVHKK